MDTNTLVVAKKDYSIHEGRKGHLLVTLPNLWVRALGLKKRDGVEVQILSDGSLRIVPVKDYHNERPGAIPDALAEVTPTSKQEVSS